MFCKGIDLQRDKNMKLKISFLLAILTAISVASVDAKPQYTTNTLTFSGASWGDGGSLDGYFTIEYIGNTPTELLSLDVTTGDGTSDSFTGYDYIYNVFGQADTVELAGWVSPGSAFSALQSQGAPANELALASLNLPYYELFLDWQGSSPISLYVGDVGGQYSSENYGGAPGIRSLNSEGGSPGPVPEPSTLALAGLSGLGLLLFGRRKNQS
jgi:hypothetical protein